ncbi:MAG: hypothetical protein ACREQ5_00450 [Candidatus Dormibacteria bacterium]
MTQRKKPPPDTVDLDALQDRPPRPQGSFDDWCADQDRVWSGATSGYDKTDNENGRSE